MGESMNIARQFEPDDWQPEPLPDGRLGPPRRRPPTAIGTATPDLPSPAYRRARHRFGPTRLQRIARTALGTTLCSAGGVTGFLAPIGLGTIVSAFSIAAGIFIAHRALTTPSSHRSAPYRQR
jgi:hypothetical protein